MKKVMLVSILAGSVFLCLATIASSSQQQQTVSKPAAGTPPDPSAATATPTLPAAPTAHSDERPNGISVGRPKVFDNRTLTIMLESLSEALRGMQTQFVNQQALAAAFAYIQGFQSREVVRNLSVSPLPLPGLKQETISTAGNVTETGTPLPDTSKVTTTSDRAAFSPQAPALDNPPAFSGFTPTYGENPSDLLSDQVNLTYQIFNLRMLLERSLSDRVLSDSDSQPRRQAVLGFNVTIDPPRKAKDAVAVVEVTLDLGKGATVRDGLSLVSLMPQEKTYNAAALSTKSNAFGGAAVVKMFQVGYSERRRGQVFYLYRDNDTVSYERMNGGKKDQVVFGWMFRPVLGRNSVSPGLRQLFAIVSLPSDDEQTNKNPQYVHASVRTYWKKYDRDTMTSFDEDEVNRAARVKYALSFNLTKPEIFSDRYVNTAKYNEIDVKSTNKYQANLTPKIQNVRWVPIGPKAALVSITGNNFFSGTQVTMGDKVYASTSDGLIIKSNQTIDITTTLDALASGPGALIGRYGPAVPLVAAPGKTLGGIRLGSPSLGPSLSGNHSLEVALLSSTPGAQLKMDDLPKDEITGRVTPILTVNGNVVPLPYTIVEDPIKNPKVLILQALIPNSFVSSGGAVVKVSWPFLSEGWTATSRIYDPAGTYRVLRLDAKKIVVMTNDPAGFISDTKDRCWTLLAGTQTIKLPGGELCKADTADVKGLSDSGVVITLEQAAPDKVVLVSPDNRPYSVDVPKVTAAAEPATPKPIELKQFDAIWVTIPVKDGTKAEAVEANQIRLKFRKGEPEKEGGAIKTIKVHITREITSKPGNIDVTVLDKEGNSIGEARLSISPVRTAMEENNDY